MQKQLVQHETNVPFTMLWANQSRELSMVEGEYNPATQKWSNRDIASLATQSRSATTGWVTDDPDEDKDD